MRDFGVMNGLYFIYVVLVNVRCNWKYCSSILLLDYLIGSFWLLYSIIVVGSIEFNYGLSTFY